jgi:UDP-N-acetylmuramate: L-alanyl-gamma-D-glutamyl-meso-diaminopimelate ligase
MIPEDGVLIYYNKDPVLNELALITNPKIQKISYSFPQYFKSEKGNLIRFEGEDFPVKLFGKHNMSNIMGAMYICKQLGISEKEFFRKIGSFTGASRRLELLSQNDRTAVYKDFAHAPSKLKATTEAVKEKNPDRELVACIELHTYSSLSKSFLSHYSGTMKAVDIPMVYFNPHALSLKRLPEITVEDVKKEFGHPDLQVFNDSEKLHERLLNMDWKNKNLLLMSSGNFDGLDLFQIAETITPRR